MIFLSSLLQNLYGTVDLLVVGNFSAKSTVSAVATGSQVMTLVTFFLLGDLILSGLLHMGAAGVAISTVAAQGISFFIALLYLMKKRDRHPFFKK